MVQEVKAYKTDDGVVHAFEDQAIVHSLIRLLSGQGNIDDVVQRLIDNDSKIVLLLQQYRRNNPR